VPRWTAVSAVLLAVVTVLSPQHGTAAEAAASEYLVGRGIADITGEPAEVGFFGYGSLGQTGTGIHTRLRSRAFEIMEAASGQRVVIVQADVGVIMDSVRQAVLAKLRQQYGSLFTEDNVLLAANHTHVGPGGYSHHNLYNLTTGGFRPKTFDAIVNGTIESINKAHADLAPATLSLGRTQLTDASAQRSRPAFDRNPPEDKAAFPPGAIDPTSSTLRIDRDGKPVGMINWFAVHATSLPNTWTLINSDNKGYAALHSEREVNGYDYLSSANPPFVAAFAQTNSGDMSPNLNLRPGSGPTEDPVQNTQILGLRQYDAALTALNSATPISGPIDYRFGYVEMGGGVEVRPEFTGDGQTHRTCHGALGASFAAGSTEDGPGSPVFGEGAGNNPVFGVISALLYTASPALRDCQAPKDILVPTGAIGFTQEIMPIQIIRVGPLYLVALGQEPTITSGLRLRRTVAGVLGVPMENVIVAGYSNSFAGYLTTPEEYDAQEYEGGHTLFGRWQLPAYQQEFARLADDLKNGRPTDKGTPSPDVSGTAIPPLIPTPIVDTPQLLHRFGDVLTQPAPGYAHGQQVSAVFAGAHPNNDLHRNGTYLEVQRQAGNNWTRVYDDGDWSTRFEWARDGIAASRVTVRWTIPPDASPGTYRIVYHGDARNLLGQTSPFTGTTRTFTLD